MKYSEVDQTECLAASRQGTAEVLSATSKQCVSRHRLQMKTSGSRSISQVGAAQIPLIIDSPESLTTCAQTVLLNTTSAVNPNQKQSLSFLFSFYSLD